MGRSLWGWGDVEARPPLEEVAGRAGAFFGALALEQPRFPDDGGLAQRLGLAPPRCALPPGLEGLAEQSELSRARHAQGKGYLDRVRAFRGQFPEAPDAVAHPADEAELVRVLEACEAAALAVVPFGGGSSVSLGVAPRLGPSHRGVVSVDLARLDKVLEVDAISRAARIQAGTLGPSLERQLAEHGLTLRHFPQSFEFSSLGGWIATRAAGHYATGPTHIDALVESVRLVTPRGVLATRRVPASGAGPDATRLVCGSEGTLGIITEAWMRVVPRPLHRASASVHFDDFARAVNATRALAQSGLQPSNCRLLDAQEALLNGVSFDGTCVLLLGFESAEHSVSPWLDRALAIATSHGGTCPKGPVVRSESGGARGGDAADSWRAAFLKGPYLQDQLIQLGVMADTFETACLWSDFARLYAEVTAAVGAALERACGGGLVTCRFTHVYADGPAPYFTFLGKVRPGGEAEAWEQVKAAADDALHRCGATATHHHAVGRMHRRNFDRERPELFAQVLRAAKRELDPAAMLNPGVLFD